MSHRFLTGLAGIVMISAALVGCGTASDQSDNPDSATSPTWQPVESEHAATLTPEPVHEFKEGDRVTVPALEEWGTATVFREPKGTEPSSRITLDFEAVPLDEFEIVDRTEGRRDCTYLSTPDVEGMYFSRVDAPNGAGAPYSEHGHFGKAAQLLCVFSDSEASEESLLFPELEAAKERAFSEGTLELRGSLPQREVVPLD